MTREPYTPTDAELRVQDRLDRALAERAGEHGIGVRAIAHGTYSWWRSKGNLFRVLRLQYQEKWITFRLLADSKPPYFTKRVKQQKAKTARWQKQRITKRQAKPKPQATPGLTAEQKAHVGSLAALVARLTEPERKALDKILAFLDEYGVLVE